MRAIYYKKWNRLNQLMGFTVPLEGMLMMVKKRAVIDIIKLDDILMKKFNYTGSMKDFVLENYGKEAADLIEELL